MPSSEHPPDQTASPAPPPRSWIEVERLLLDAGFLEAADAEAASTEHDLSGANSERGSADTDKRRVV
jgi:hypothetical protein